MRRMLSTSSLYNKGYSDAGIVASLSRGEALAHPQCCTEHDCRRERTTLDGRPETSSPGRSLEPLWVLGNVSQQSLGASNYAFPFQPIAVPFCVDCVCCSLS